VIITDFGRILFCENENYFEKKGVAGLFLFANAQKFVKTKNIFITFLCFQNNLYFCRHKTAQQCARFPINFGNLRHFEKKHFSFIFLTKNLAI